MLALSSAIGPISGQNWGADQKARVVEALKKSYLLCALWSVISAGALYIIAPYIAVLFSENQDVIDLVTRYLMIVPITLGGYGITIVAAGCFNAIGQPIKGLISYFIRTVAFYVPLSWIAGTIFDESTAIFAAIAIANIAAGLGVFIWSWVHFKGVEPRS